MSTRERGFIAAVLLLVAWAPSGSQPAAEKPEKKLYEELKGFIPRALEAQRNPPLYEALIPQWEKLEPDLETAGAFGGGELKDLAVTARGLMNDAIRPDQYKQLQELRTDPNAETREKLRKCIRLIHPYFAWSEEKRSFVYEDGGYPDRDGGYADLLELKVLLDRYRESCDKRDQPAEEGPSQAKKVASSSLSQAALVGLERRLETLHALVRSKSMDQAREELNVLFDWRKAHARELEALPAEGRLRLDEINAQLKQLSVTLAYHVPNAAAEGKAEPGAPSPGTAPGRASHSLKPGEVPKAAGGGLPEGSKLSSGFDFAEAAFQAFGDLGIDLTPEAAWQRDVIKRHFAVRDRVEGFRPGSVVRGKDGREHRGIWIGYKDQNACFMSADGYFERSGPAGEQWFDWTPSPSGTLGSPGTPGPTWSPDPKSGQLVMRFEEGEGLLLPKGVWPVASPDGKMILYLKMGSEGIPAEVGREGLEPASPGEKKPVDWAFPVDGGGYVEEHRDAQSGVYRREVHLLPGEFLRMMREGKPDLSSLVGESEAQDREGIERLLKDLSAVSPELAAALKGEIARDGGSEVTHAVDQVYWRDGELRIEMRAVSRGKDGRIAEQAPSSLTCRMEGGRLQADFVADAAKPEEILAFSFGDDPRKILVERSELEGKAGLKFHPVAEVALTEGKWVWPEYKPDPKLSESLWARWQRGSERVNRAGYEGLLTVGTVAKEGIVDPVMSPFQSALHLLMGGVQHVRGYHSGAAAAAEDAFLDSMAHAPLSRLLREREGVLGSRRERADDGGLWVDKIGSKYTLHQMKLNEYRHGALREGEGIAKVLDAARGGTFEFDGLRGTLGRAREKFRAADKIMAANREEYDKKRITGLFHDSLEGLTDKEKPLALQFMRARWLESRRRYWGRAWKSYSGEEPSEDELAVEAAEYFGFKNLEKVFYELGAEECDKAGNLANREETFHGLKCAGYYAMGAGKVLGEDYVESMGVEAMMSGAAMLIPKTLGGVERAERAVVLQKALHHQHLEHEEFGALHRMFEAAEKTHKVSDKLANFREAAEAVEKIGEEEDPAKRDEAVFKAVSILVAQRGVVGGHKD
ncbi:MAG: hypothetical protein HY077_00460 [Elusimicrobia bacterium]|nr:hypothetical protein [Elusimicrobiota bacterium]